MPAFKWWTETRSLVASLSFCLVAVSGGSALAVPEDACIKDEKCKDHYSKGVKLYKEENFDEALTEFQAAYASRQMPLLLVNIGRTMQKLGRPKDALGYYERFLRAEPKIDAETKRRVEDYITQVKALIDSEPAKPAPVAEPVKPVALTPAVPQPPPPGRNMMLIGGGVALLGVAGLLTGVGLWAASNSQFQSFQNSHDEFEKLAFKSKAQDLGNGSVVAYILGTVALGTGGALFGIGVRDYIAHKKAGDAGNKPAADKPATTAALVPLAGGGALMVQGGF